MGSEKNPGKALAEIGKQLASHSRPSKHFLVKSLQKGASILVELEQLSSLKPFITPFTNSLLNLSLLHHKDKDVRLLVALCFSQILRILAPDPSFPDSLFNDIFQLFISIFKDLSDTASPYFHKRLLILHTLATLECSRRMLDLDSHHLIRHMFITFFSAVRQGHPQSLTNGMLSIMSLLLNEQEDTPHPLLDIILQNLTNKGEPTSPASYNLAVALIQNCAQKLKPAICGFIMSCISDRQSVPSDLKECYHQLIFEIFQCAPDILFAIIPNLIEELVTDQVDTRIKAVTLIGKLLALNNSQDFHGHHHLFVELLKRFSDKSADVRISVMRAVKGCYMANPSGVEAHKILSCFEGRLLDLDASVRVVAVAIVCDLSMFSLKSFPENLISRVTDRLRDKMTSVRKEALTKLVEVYREYCSKCYDGQMQFDGRYEHIPCNILVLSLDNNLKEFRPQTLERLLEADLFPSTLSGQDRMAHWIYLYSLFTPVHIKAVNLILFQKRRFQAEMRAYLSLRLKEKGVDVEEVNTRTKKAFSHMSATFPNPTKVEECFIELNQLKDTSLLFPLMQLLDEPSLLNAMNKRDKYLKDMGDKHSLFEFLELLSLKCSNNVFSSEHIQHILDHVSRSCSRGLHVEESSFNLLSDAVRNFPLLLRDTEDKFTELILEEDSAASEKILLIVAKLGPSISIKLSQIYVMLERLCLEGTRAQSKAAISVIASSLGCSEESLLLDLCQKLVESLRCDWKIPTALQSLGCLFQYSGLAFQLHQEEVSSYIREQIFNDKTAKHSGSADEISQSEVSSSCKLKIYGLKTLVKSVLPKKGTHGAEQMGDLMDILSKVLIGGEFTAGISACENDMAHLRLAAAKSVLRLSRQWDMHISPHIFRSTIVMAKDASPLIRKAFLAKTYKLLKRHMASRRFACAFTLAASDCIRDLQDVSFKYFLEFIKEHGRAANTCLPSNKEDSMTHRPEYMVVFLLHALAHDAMFPPIDSPNEAQFAEFCRPLLLALHAFLNSQYVDGNSSVVNKACLHLQSIFQAIRKAEDAVEPENSLKLHVLADVGIFALNLIQPTGIDLSLTLGVVLLPSSLYRTITTRKRNEESCSLRKLVNEEFVRKLVRTFEYDFSRASQVSSSSVKRVHNSLKDGDQANNVIYSLGSKQADKLQNLTTQKKLVPKEIIRTRVLEACPKVKKLKNIDGASVFKDLGADIFQNLKHLPSSKSSNAELFGMESDISTQGFDVSLPVSQDENTKRSSYDSANIPQLSLVKFNDSCSSDGSTVSFLGQRDANKQCALDEAEIMVTDPGNCATKTRGPRNGERKILVDKTNSLAVNRSRKFCQPKSIQGHTIHLETLTSDEKKDVIAHRTRRRRITSNVTVSDDL